MTSQWPPCIWYKLMNDWINGRYHYMVTHNVKPRKSRQIGQVSKLLKIRVEKRLVNNWIQCLENWFADWRQPKKWHRTMADITKEYTCSVIRDWRNQKITGSRIRQADRMDTMRASTRQHDINYRGYDRRIMLECVSFTISVRYPVITS